MGICSCLFGSPVQVKEDDTYPEAMANLANPRTITQQNGYGGKFQKGKTKERDSSEWSQSSSELISPWASTSEKKINNNRSKDTNPQFSFQNQDRPNKDAQLGSFKKLPTQQTQSIVPAAPLDSVNAPKLSVRPNHSRVSSTSSRSIPPRTPSPGQEQLIQNSPASSPTEERCLRKNESWLKDPITSPWGESSIGHRISLQSKDEESKRDVHCEGCCLHTDSKTPSLKSIKPTASESSESGSSQSEHKAATKASIPNSIPFPTELGRAPRIGLKKAPKDEFTSNDEDNVEKLMRGFEDIGGIKRLPLKHIRLKCENGEHVILGTGGFGRVYLGSLYKEECAIKVVLQGNRREQARFLKEIKILEMLKCKYITAYKGYGVCPEGLCMLMEYIPGGTLFESIKKDDSFHWYKRGRQALLEIAIALNVLHNNQVSHLDLKSANVLLRENGEVVVADVGLSKLMKQDSTNVSLPGTFAYSSPEQLQGRAGLKSDIWSFGTVLHEVCTGEIAPTRRYWRPIKVPEEASQAAVDLLAKCHEPAPENRPTAEELCDFLEACA